MNCLLYKYQETVLYIILLSCKYFKTINNKSITGYDIINKGYITISLIYLGSE